MIHSFIHRLLAQKEHQQVPDYRTGLFEISSGQAVIKFACPRQLQACLSLHLVKIMDFPLTLPIG